MKKLAGILCAVAFAAVLQVPIASLAHAETSTTTVSSSTDITSLLNNLKSLMAKVADLRSQIGQVQTQVHAAITTDLKQGMTSDQIKQIQELLASDKSIYPEGITSGYFGGLTKKALERFQDKHGLPKSGEVDQNTQDLLNQYLDQRFGTTTVPHGLLTAPGIVKKVQDNICGKEGRSGGAWGLFCKDFDHMGTSTSHDNGDDNDHATSTKKVCTLGLLWPYACNDHGTATSSVDHGITVSIKISTSTATSSISACTISGTVVSRGCPNWAIHNASATVTFTFDGKTYTAVSQTVSQSNVLKAVATALGVTPDKLNPTLVREVKKALDAARVHAHVWF